MRHFPIAFLFFACLGNVEAIAQTGENASDNDPEMTLEQILVENWNSAAESTRSSHLRLKVHRKLFDGVSFDAPSFVRKLRIAVQDSQLENFLGDQFQKLYAVDGRSRNPYWGYTAEVWHRPNASRILWHDHKAARIGESVFDPRGVATRIDELNQIQLTNSSTTERLAFNEVLFLPLFKNADGIKPVERSKLDPSFLELIPDLDRFLIVNSSKDAHTLVVDPESGFVVAARHQRGAKVRIRFNFVPVEIPQIGIYRPSVYCKISFDEHSQPSFLEVAVIEDCEVNTRVPDDNFFLAVAENSAVLDLRNGVENARVYSPRDAQASVFEFIRTAKSADNGDPAAARGKDSNRNGGDGTDSSGDLSRVLPPPADRIITGRTPPGSEVAGASTIVVLFCVSIAALFVRIFSFPNFSGVEE